MEQEMAQHEDELWDRVFNRENLKAALERVRQNRGAPGVDGMTVEELPEHLKKHWASIREKLETGKYRPSPVKRVEISKPGGGQRKLGIPTVLDRMIQQALQQVLSEEFEGTFSEHSYGFRPGRSAQDAVEAAREYIEAGYQWTVDIDLEKFFDTVHHDRLMARMKARIADKRVLRLVQLGVNMYPVVQPAAQLLKVLRPACIIYYGLLLRNTSGSVGMRISINGERQ